MLDPDDVLAQLGQADLVDLASLPSPTQPEAVSRFEPISSGAASCVEFYFLDTLANRQTAFDGTVVAVDGDDVTFTVNEWFTDSGSDEVTLRSASMLGAITSAGDPLDLSPGTRLLVAGNGGFAWSCGFIQPYDPTTAQDWASVFESPE